MKSYKQNIINELDKITQIKDISNVIYEHYDIINDRDIQIYDEIIDPEVKKENEILKQYWLEIRYENIKRDEEEIALELIFNNCNCGKNPTQCLCNGIHVNHIFDRYIRRRRKEYANENEGNKKKLKRKKRFIWEKYEHKWQFNDILLMEDHFYSIWTREQYYKQGYIAPNKQILNIKGYKDTVINRRNLYL